MPTKKQSTDSQVETNLLGVHAKAKVHSKNKQQVIIIAVSKTQPLEKIETAISLGIKHFGENRIEEIEEKWKGLDKKLRDKTTLHMVGQVQSRKAARVVAQCDWVHSVDRLKLAKKLGEAADQLNKKINVLVQVNTSGERQKSGYWLADWFESKSEECLKLLENDLLEISKIKGVELRGLMTMAPFVQDEEVRRTTFRRLRKLRDHLVKANPSLDLEHLSMGMTNDYEIAVEEGATMLRVGRAVFEQ